MNKLARVILTLLIMGSMSCQKVEDLLPFEYPGMLDNLITRVSVLEDGSLLVIGVDGIYVRYPDNSTSVIPVNSSETDLSATHGMKFMKGTNVIYGVSASYILVIRNNDYQFYSSGFFTNGLLSYPEYIMTPDYELLMLSYGESRYNPDINGYENPVRISRWNSSGWDYADSDIYVSELYSSVPPSMVFETNYRAYIWIDKLYEIGYNEYDDLEFEEIIPVNDDISSNTIYTASLVKNEIVGFDKELDKFGGSISSTIGQSIIFNTTTGEISGSNPSATCGVEPFGSLNFDQYLGMNDSKAYFYVESVFNSFSSETKRGDIFSYDVYDGTCHFDVILATGPLQGLDIQIVDLDIDWEKELLYIGTNRGLYIYDQVNHTIETYLENLKDENQE